MEKISFDGFIKVLTRRTKAQPLSGQIELTYCCYLSCRHCYSKGLEDKKRELSTQQWKDIFDKMRHAGCLFLNFTGGDPLVRKDFLELYGYAKKKGFIIQILTSGFGFDRKTIAYLKKFPPLSIDITLNSINKKTFESITQRKNSFERVVANIKALAGANLKVILKFNCLMQNKNEIAEVKAWAEEILGKPAQKRYRFKYDPFIFPRLNGDKSPLKYRISFRELMAIRKKDPDIWRDYLDLIKADIKDPSKDKDLLYNCNSWMESFFIDPYGRLKFCALSNKFSVDLKKASFQDSYYGLIPQISQTRFKTNSPCRSCALRPICLYCPARAYLETGNEEGPVKYFCEFAKKAAREMHKNRQQV